MHSKHQKKVNSDLSRIKVGPIVNQLAHRTSKDFPLMLNEQRDFLLHEEVISCVSSARTVNTNANLCEKFSGEAATWEHLNKCYVTVKHGKYRCVLKSPSGEEIDMEEQQFDTLWELCRRFIDPSKKYVVIIDEVMVPYYGKDKDLNAYVVGGKTKDSTRTFFKYFSVYLKVRNERYILGVIPATKGTMVANAVRQLMSHVINRGVNIDYVLADRGYYNTEVMQYFQEENISFIMPVKMAGKDLIEGVNGLKKTDSFVRHMNTKDGRGIDVDIVVVLTRKVPLEEEEDYVERIDPWYRYAYVCSGITMGNHKVFNVYRERFGIEATYRLLSQNKVKTCTRNPAIRYLFVILNFCLQNVWRTTQQKHCIIPKAGPKVLDKNLLRFDAFCARINKTLDWIFKLSSSFKGYT